MENIKLCNFHYNTPFEVPNLENSVGRFGAIIATGNNPKQAISETEKAFKKLKLNGFSLNEYNDYSLYNNDFNQSEKC